MARYICPKCGDTFDCPDRERYAGEEWNCCPTCGNPDFEPASRCACCWGDFLEGDLTGGLCEDCLESEATAADFAVFAHDPDVRECFAEWLVERHAEKWRQRRRKALRGVL
jgi:hypothetical protein